ncbi:MAG: GntR family transcriptional regulator [Streptosporangiaceae bacterium]
MQVHDYYAQLIAGGQLAPGDRLPTMQDIADEFGVSTQTAWRALQRLQSSGLITISRDHGSIVGKPRLIQGPQQRISAARLPTAERTEVLSAGIVPAPEYVVPILGLEAGPRPGGAHWVIRREQVSYEHDGTPFMLAVAWFPASLADAVPELLERKPIIAPGGAARLIGERTARRITRGSMAREARPIKDDGREGPLLGLTPGTVVLAEVYVWMDDTDAIEYGEYCLIQSRVTENEFTVES